MKELSIEEKAKAYDEAKARMNRAWNDNRCTLGFMNEIFPELKEPDDEKIGKEIISHLKYLGQYCQESMPNVDKWIAWLEKQGEPVEINPTEFDTRLQVLIGKFDSLPKEELIGSLSFWLNVVQNDGTYKPAKKQDEQTTIQDYNSIDPHFCKPVEYKPADKVEPKFHEGDWITNGEFSTQIVAVGSGLYVINRKDMSGVSLSTKYVEKWYHLWTIQDAKDGDVLAFDDETIVIFKDLYNATTFHSYCHIENAIFSVSQNGMPDWWEAKGFKPATKEQHNLLFQKMKEAGYEWNTDKKELKKIVIPIFNIGDTIIKKHNSDIHDFGSFVITDITGGKYWYNDRIICNITEQDEWEIYEYKPTKWSEEQIGALANACKILNLDYLNSLYQDLKKLKG